MHLFSSPFSSRGTPASVTSSPPSSRTTSPPSSPSSPSSPSRRAPSHLFDLAFHPHPPSPPSPSRRPTSNPDAHAHHSTLSTTTNPTPTHCVSILPCAVLRGRSSLMVVRRRPSAIDVALTAERCRCTGDAIERQGLDLMEPRPVDAGSGPGTAGAAPSVEARPVQQPRFVMGGIFEVMEGRA
ncbi:hypothetical protein N7462_005395 [Penicillium macrosclerotiorum]|uniref:uncharacterized protein n=1 Tax=Penicillium macrosclerotiorum TaxID=303699 RepID=UPI002546DDFE|nr:uncharacterized protein N7462_005395 [Penicillium macrosclerotiorum]KAJ5682230.1 hypothetical protein N7462_005395 [Penicillium macrosclerotiorum]